MIVVMLAAVREGRRDAALVGMPGLIAEIIDGVHIRGDPHLGYDRRANRAPSPKEI